MTSLRDELQDVQDKVDLYLSVNRFDAAEKLLHATLSDYGSLANIHNLLGVTYHRQSRFIDAIREFTKALKANPQFSEAALNLAATYCDLSRYDDAREVYATVTAQVSSRKKVPDLVLGRLANQHAQNGRLYEECTMYADAIQEYRKALTLFSRMPDVQLALAKLYYRSGQIERAQKEFEELIVSGANSPEARTWLSILNYKLGKKGQARKLWEQAQAITPNDPAAKAYARLSRDWPVDADPVFG